MSALGIKDEGRGEEGEEEGDKMRVVMILHCNPAFPKTEAPYPGTLLSLLPTSYPTLLLHQKKKVYWKLLVLQCIYSYGKHRTLTHNVHS